MTITDLLHLAALLATVGAAGASTFKTYRLLRRDEGDRELFRHAFDKTNDLRVIDTYADVARGFRRGPAKDVPAVGAPTRSGDGDSRPPPAV